MEAKNVSKLVKILLTLMLVLVLFLAAMLLVPKYLLGIDIFDLSGWNTSEDGSVQYLDTRGKPLTGWQTIENNRYYFDPATGKAVDGVQTIKGYTYTFTDKVLTRGQIVTNSTGSRYMWAGAWATQEWLEIDGKMYYARSNAYFATGLENRFNQALERA